MKQSVLIVDDELIVVQNIRDNIRWETIGIDTVYTALSLVQAQEVFRSHPVDVMVCDIEMPEGNGIELMAWVREHFPQTVTLFLTCHEDFSYAKQAVKLGAFDYLLKPIPYDELEYEIFQAAQHSKKVQYQSQILDTFCPGEEQQADVIQNVKQIVSQLISHDLTREQIAELVHLAPDYLSHLFKKETGMTLSDYIVEQRLLLAKHLLAHTKLPVGSIADKVGYSYVSYFNRVFKKAFDMTPVEYRRKTKSSE